MYILPPSSAISHYLFYVAITVAYVNVYLNRFSLRDGGKEQESVEVR